MFHRSGKSIKSTQTKPLKDLTRILPAAQLFGDEKRQVLLKKIMELSGLEPTRYDSIGLNLIHNLGNYYQNLPETANGYYAAAGGLLDHALNRTEAALGLLRQLIIKEEQEDYSEEQKLWLYADG